MTLIVARDRARVPPRLDLAPKVTNLRGWAKEVPQDIVLRRGDISTMEE